MLLNFPKGVLYFCFLGLFVLTGCTRREHPASPQVILAPHQIMVAGGDTIYALAHKHGVSTRSLIEANRLQAPYRIYAGQILVLPEQEAPVSRVPQPVEHMDPSLGERGGPVSIHKSLEPLPVIGAFPEKPLGAGDKQQDRVSSEVMPKKQLVVLDPDIARELDLEQERLLSKKSPPGLTPLPQPVGRTSPSVKAADANIKFPWPVKGKIIGKYGRGSGKGGNDGIRISAPAGTSIKTIQKGKIIYAGNEIKNLGNLILIEHANKWISAYGCVRKILVKKGDVVEKGDIIAEVGQTGDVNQPQLYFELRKDKKTVDPEVYLGS